MKARLYLVLTLAAILSLMLSGAAAAQLTNDGGDPRPGRRSGGPAETYELPDDPVGGFPWLPKARPAAEKAGSRLNAANAPNVEVGAPGLTYSHVQTYGVAEQAFLADTNHFHYPYGVYASGFTLWVADSDQNRAVKFDSAGVYQNLTLGIAGFREGKGDVDLEWVVDVEVDAGGNIWLVDAGARHVAKFNSSGEYQFSIGEPWGGDFGRPWGIAIDAAGNVYVSDYYGDCIDIFDSSGNFLATLGSYGSGAYNFDGPRHITIFNNLLYVADEYNHRVQIYDVTNPNAITYVGTLGTGSSGSANGQFRRPQGVAVNADKIFVADAGNRRIQVFNNSAPFSYVAKFGSYGTAHGQFEWPADVAVDGAGNIYVADNQNHRVEQFSSSYAYQRTYGTTGVPYLTDQYHYNSPSDVALDGDHNLYISEGRGQRIVKLRADGVPLWQVGENGVAGDDNSHFNAPESIAASPDGRVFVVDAWNDRVQVFNGSTGAYLATLGGYGWGNGQFDFPLGIAVDRHGNIYVADAYNCRIQKFNSALQYVAKLGSCGDGNTEFWDIADIAVDTQGRIYVVDQGNQRVQLFDSNFNYLRMIGSTGLPGRDYDRLENPTAVAVDGMDRVSIADRWGSAIKTYDKDGKFLNILQNGSGSFQGVFRQTAGIAADSSGNIYMADHMNHQVKKYIPSAYQGWRQVNVAGFGSRLNQGVWSLTTFGNKLFASTLNFYGTELHYLDQGNWVKAMSGGFGDDTNAAIDGFESFKGSLYAGTWNEGSNGGQIWRSSDPAAGSWQQVVGDGFGSATNSEVMSLKAFDGFLYAGTLSNDTDDHGAEIYRSDTGDGGDWELVFDDSVAGHDPAEAVMVMEAFNGDLYAGLYNWDYPAAELWRTSDGVTWTQVNTDGFGDANNYVIITLAVFDGQLYAGVGNYDGTARRSHGAQVWRSADGTSWEKVVDAGFDEPNNSLLSNLTVYQGQIYATTHQVNYDNRAETKGMEVWRSASGDLATWERVGWHAFGAEFSSAWANWHGIATVHDDLFYIGTYGNSISGGRIWSFLPVSIYLPVISR